MTEEEKKQISVFRFSVISDFVLSTSMSRQEKIRLMVDKCSRKWQIPFSEKTRISPPTGRECGTFVQSVHKPESMASNPASFPPLSSALQQARYKINAIFIADKYFSSIDSPAHDMVQYAMRI